MPVDKDEACSNRRVGLHSGYTVYFEPEKEKKGYTLSPVTL